METSVKKMAVALMVLVVLTPLGLLAVGETFGEWGNEEIQEKLGYVPSGLEGLSSLWSAPLPDYAFPGDETTVGSVAAYVLSAIIGILICGGLLYLFGKKVARN
ncbi:MAG: cobalamin biosynthesis protein [Methanosarcinales archaeon]|nr:cobalamin biosynthesis protein [Methanosarcinales archaeon]